MSDAVCNANKINLNSNFAHLGSLIVWDVRTAEPTREVKLDCANLQLCPKMLLPASGSVICDYGNELRIVRFPMIADKRD